MNVAFLGATKGMGRALARQMAARGDRLFLLGRDVAELERSAVDLAVRADSEPVKAAACDLERPETFAPALAAAKEALGKIDCVVVTAGLFGTQDQLEADLDFARRVLTVNYANTVIFCEHARHLLMEGGGGTLCVFSSVAGDRGRKPVALYGSSKAGLSHYLESLDHKYRADGLVTVCVKPGFVKTGMTEGLKPPPFAGDPEGVASRVLAAIDAKKPMVYAPFMWGWIMLVIRSLPRLVMRRVGF
ncbi:MAG: SDR family NAD(P)-dependent oxidoreductase [Alphaproteobacteria bacterium]|nr:SDR family NAD(P)-dependent oxidoreductase [Alphaproteobacteria bacterium]